MTDSDKLKLFVEFSKRLKELGFVQRKNDERYFDRQLIVVFNCPHRCSGLKIKFNPISDAIRCRFDLRGTYEEELKRGLDFIDKYLKT